MYSLTTSTDCHIMDVQQRLGWATMVNSSLCSPNRTRTRSQGYQEPPKLQKSHLNT